MQVAVLDFIGPFRGEEQENPEGVYEKLRPGEPPLLLSEIEESKAWIKSWDSGIDGPEVRIVHNISMDWFFITGRQDTDVRTKTIRINDRDLDEVIEEVLLLIRQWYGTGAS